MNASGLSKCREAAFPEYPEIPATPEKPDFSGRTSHKAEPSSPTLSQTHVNFFPPATKKIGN